MGSVQPNSQSFSRDELRWCVRNLAPKANLCSPSLTYLVFPPLGASLWSLSFSWQEETGPPSPPEACTPAGLGSPGQTVRWRNERWVVGRVVRGDFLLHLPTSALLPPQGLPSFSAHEFPDMLVFRPSRAYLFVYPEHRL